MTRNEIKAHALQSASETLLIAATLAVGLTVFHLLVNFSEPFAFVSAITVGFGVASMLKPMLSAVFGPAIDRLRGTKPAKTVGTAPTATR